MATYIDFVNTSGDVVTINIAYQNMPHENTSFGLIDGQTRKQALTYNDSILPVAFTLNVKGDSTIFPLLKIEKLPNNKVRFTDFFVQSNPIVQEIPAFATYKYNVDGLPDDFHIEPFSIRENYEVCPPGMYYDGASGKCGKFEFVPYSAPTTKPKLPQPTARKNSKHFSVSQPKTYFKEYYSGTSFNTDDSRIKVYNHGEDIGTQFKYKLYENGTNSDNIPWKYLDKNRKSSDEVTFPRGTDVVFEVWSPMYGYGVKVNRILEPGKSYWANQYENFNNFRFPTIEIKEKQQPDDDWNPYYRG